MRIALVALPRLRVVRTGEARVDIGRVRLPEEIALAQIPAEAVINSIAGLVDMQLQVRERAVSHALVGAGPVAPEARVRVEDDRVGQGHGAGLDGDVVGLLVPVGLRARVVALRLQEQLVHAHIQPVPGEEGADVVHHVGLRYVDVV